MNACRCKESIQTPQETLQQSRQIITGVALALNAWFRNPSWTLFGRNSDVLSCRVFYWAINSLLLTCMCLMYHEAENMFGVLQGRWHNVWEHGNIDFAVRLPRRFCPLLPGIWISL